MKTTVSIIKADYIAQGGILEFVDAKDTMANLGGYHAFRDELGYIKKTITKLAQTYGCRTGQGACFIGPPGTGKTALAEKIANELERPLVKAKFGEAFDSNTAGLIATGLSAARSTDTATNWGRPVLPKSPR